MIVQCTYFNKSVLNNWFVAFHQDRSIPVAASVPADRWSGWSQKEGMTFIHGPDELLSQMLAIRLHIDDSTPDNGPLSVIPNSHQYGTLLPKQIEALRKFALPKSLIVNVGSVIAMRPLLLHASSKSHASQDRRILHFLFGPTLLPRTLKWQNAI